MPGGTRAPPGRHRQPSGSRALSAPLEHRFQVLARDDQSPLAAAVVLHQHAGEVGLELLLAALVQGSKGLVGRAVVSAKDIDEVGGGLVPKDEVATLAVDESGAVTEQALESRLVAPSEYR